MSDSQSTSREEWRKLVRSDQPFYTSGGDPDDPNDLLNYQPNNIPAVIANHLRSLDAHDTERMRSFSLRIEETDHLRLTLLADALGASKTTLARELLQTAIVEAIYSLPEEMREELRRKFMEAL